MKPYVYCPMCGTLLTERTVYGLQRQACPACDFVYFRDPKVAAAVLIDDGDRVLLIRRAVDPRSGYWALPAGFVEEDELPAEAACREVLEETGLTVAVGELLRIRRTSNPKKPGFLVTYRGQLLGGQLQAADDVSEARWFRLEEIPWDDLAFESTIESLQAWAAAQPG